MCPPIGLPYYKRVSIPLQGNTKFKKSVLEYHKSRSKGMETIPFNKLGCKKQRFTVKPSFARLVYRVDTGTRKNSY